VFSAASAQETLHLQNGWMYRADSGMVTGAFLTIHNPTERADTITAVSCDCAEYTEIHTTIRQSDGTFGMRPLRQLIVPAKKTIVLKPRSLHVMLYHLRRTLRAGDRCRLVLTSKRFGALPIELDVRQ
jgi:hypothetical protein